MSKSLFDAADGTDKLPLYTHLLSVAVLALSLAVVGASLKRRHRGRTVGRLLLAGSVAAMALSVPFMAQCDTASTSGLMLMALSSVLSGLGSAFYFIVWGTRFRAIGCTSTLVEVSAAALYAAIAGVLVDLAPLAARIIVTMALPVLSAALLVVSERTVSPWAAPIGEAGGPTPPFGEFGEASDTSYRRFLTRVIGCMLCFGIVTGLLKEPLFALSEFDSSRTLELLLMASFVVALLSVAGACLRQRNICSVLYRCSFAALSLSIVVLLIAGSPTDPSVGLFLFGTAGVQVLLWGILAGVRAPYDDTARLLGFGLSALYAGIFLGSLGSYLATAAHWASPPVVNPLVATVLLGLAYSFILPDRAFGLDGALTGGGPADESVPADAAEGAEGASENLGLLALAARHDLTPRETEVFLLIAQGHTGKRIEETLAMSGSTVKTHRYRIYEKMGVATRQELIDLVNSHRS